MAFLHAAALLCIFCVATAEITASVRNVALRGRATMSTNFADLSAAINAIDGNMDSLFQHGSCFSTQLQFAPWWRVDLLRSYQIHYIKITNRGDCCADYLNGAEIYVGDSLDSNGNNNPLFGKITSIPLAGTETFHAITDMTGRYVNVMIPGDLKYLTFCEIQIFGVPVSNECGI